MVKKLSKTPKISLVIGRTATGFNKFLEDNDMTPIEPEALAGFVIRGFENFANKDREASNVLLKEIWALVGAPDAKTAVEVTRQFGKLCDFYRTILDYAKEDSNQ